MKTQLHYTVNANIKKINLIGNLVVFHLKKIKKEHLELNGNMFYQHHILVLNLTLGKKGTQIVKVKVVKSIKVEDALKKFIQNIEKCSQIFIIFNLQLEK